MAEVAVVVGKESGSVVVVVVVVAAVADNLAVDIGNTAAVAGIDYDPHPMIGMAADVGPDSSSWTADLYVDKFVVSIVPDLVVPMNCKFRQSYYLFCQSVLILLS